ncbi:MULTISPECIES: metal-sensing transcriptional repressor [Pseudomonas]|jgi:DNA-binding FrmR family transcriptional regulator|uniref:Metal-sensing transcriptional repressor n=1 Tax=Ectopseudomonas mendocina TaxID=300 RepID=A0ABZ2RJK4_ECTME|nr:MULTISPECIES: metal-sensing transcriptional repressor [Pseudomonas]ATR85478.1 transcriptional regulator [Pseudomonas sp. HLS-6]
MIELTQLEHRDSLLKRLARVEGQVRGIQAMIKRGDECESIAQQFSAARKALDKAYQEMLICLAEEAILTPDHSNQDKLAQVRAIFTKYT